MSSPSANNHYSSALSDFDEEFGISQEPTTCDCQNQRAHWDWNGVVHADLPELCRRTMGIGPVSGSQKNSR